MNQKQALLLSGAVFAALVFGGLLSLVVMKDGNDDAVVTVTLDQQSAVSGTFDSTQEAPREVTEATTAEQPGDPGNETDARPEIIEHVLESWTGDLDGMVERGFVRLLTAYNPIYLNYDGIDQKGLAVDLSSGRARHRFQSDELTGNHVLGQTCLQVVT